MFAAQLAVSGCCPYNPPSSRSLRSPANPPGLKGCRGRVQPGAPLTLHFLCKSVQWDFGVKCLFFFRQPFSFCQPPLFFFNAGEVIDAGTRLLPPRTLLSHLSITAFLGSRLGTQTHQQKCDARLLAAAGNGIVLAQD